MNKRLILSLLNLPGIGNKTVKFIVTTILSEKSLLNENNTMLDSENIVDILKYCKSFNRRIRVPNALEVSSAFSSADRILDQCHNNEIKTLSLVDNDFPTRLNDINNPCVFLYIKGNMKCLGTNNSISIVGTRHPTTKGKNISRRLGYLFGNKHYTIVSGLANGCDENAHLGCINAQGTTVAILPSGIINIYPSKNTALANSILENNGCLVSEYPPSALPCNAFFVERDRLQSALSKVLIVVETDIIGGTIHTINFAKEYNKIIFCYSSKENYFVNANQTRGNRLLLNSNDIFPLRNSNDIDKIESIYLSQSI